MVATGQSGGLPSFPSFSPSFEEYGGLRDNLFEVVIDKTGGEPVLDRQGSACAVESVGSDSVERGSNQHSVPCVRRTSVVGECPIKRQRVATESHSGRLHTYGMVAKEGLRTSSEEMRRDSSDGSRDVPSELLHASPPMGQFCNESRGDSLGTGGMSSDMPPVIKFCNESRGDSLGTGGMSSVK